jgi:hypothetical protein
MLTIIKLLFACLLVHLFGSLRAQEKRLLKSTIPTNKELQQLIDKARQPQVISLSRQTLNNPAALSTFIKKNSERQLPLAKGNKILSETPCLDSSFVRLEGIVDNALYSITITRTKDDRL